MVKGHGSEVMGRRSGLRAKKKRPSRQGRAQRLAVPPCFLPGSRHSVEYGHGGLYSCPANGGQLRRPYSPAHVRISVCGSGRIFRLLCCPGSHHLSGFAASPGKAYSFPSSPLDGGIIPATAGRDKGNCSHQTSIQFRLKQSSKVIPVVIAP